MRNKSAPSALLFGACARTPRPWARHSNVSIHVRVGETHGGGVGGQDEGLRLQLWIFFPFKKEIIYPQAALSKHLRTTSLLTSGKWTVFTTVLVSLYHARTTIGNTYHTPLYLLYLGIKPMTARLSHHLSLFLYLFWPWLMWPQFSGWWYLMYEQSHMLWNVTPLSSLKGVLKLFLCVLALTGMFNSFRVKSDCVEAKRVKTCNLKLFHWTKLQVFPHSAS